jgi:hypothetical protein
VTGGVQEFQLDMDPAMAVAELDGGQTETAERLVKMAGLLTLGGQGPTQYAQRTPGGLPSQRLQQTMPA